MLRPTISSLVYLTLTAVLPRLSIPALIPYRHAVRRRRALRLCIYKSLLDVSR
jgi:hypothetical protein